ncbi:MAG: pyridoxal 5'-phosphate synthase glutaminase subunit PdxT [bacterium]|jgi:5'-phosphate synthase pdxT subunit|nr:pyridoxal 5'-phosphate synthase glutaminase subunit PdxT [bacterium]
MSASPLIGVLAMQGAYREHLSALERCGARTRVVRLPEDLVGLDGLVIPGGESTTMQILLERMGILEAVRGAVQGGLPTLGTCAGMILLSSEITDGRAGQRSFGALDVSVRRNGYGRQVDSFEADLDVHGLPGGSFPGVFIRAPLVERVGKGAEVLAVHDGHAVALRQGNVMALCFHPELSDDLRLHRSFIDLVEAATGREEQASA